VEQRGKTSAANALAPGSADFPSRRRRPAAPERSEGAKGLRSLRRETPKVAPVAAEETEGFRGREARQGAPAPRVSAGPAAQNSREFIGNIPTSGFEPKNVTNPKLLRRRQRNFIPPPAPRRLAEPRAKQAPVF